MRHISVFHTRVMPVACVLLTALCGSICAARHGGHGQAPLPVEALVYSTMPSTAAHRPEMAMDGDSNTYFQTVYGMDDGDDFIVLFSQAIPVRAIRVTTGDTDGNDLLTNAVVETSADGATYRTAATFDKTGVAEASLKGVSVAAVRIRLEPGTGVPALVIREITLDSPVPISHVQLGPGRGVQDISQAPDLAVWSQNAERQMEEFWPDTEALLYSDKFIPPNMVNVVYKTGPNVTGVAATGGGVMTVNSAYCRAHPDDTALTVHEDAHVVQAYPTYNPVWLVEGIADYIRWVKFEPEQFRVQINPQTATYHDSYRTSAAFLGWCELHYDSSLVTKLNRAMRFNTFDIGLFKTYCGKDVDSLWAEFIAAYQADPTGILSPIVPPADKPRTLPTVTPGSSVPTDLSGVFNTTGIGSDGTALPGAGGVDGEGNGYSAALLNGPLTVGGVLFHVGSPNVPDMVSCKGQVVPLPAGQYGSLWLLGTGVEGSQNGQTLTVTYTDGTTAALYQNFSDWYQPGRFPGETRAIVMPYRLKPTGEKDMRTFYVYRYGFALDPAKTVKSVTLPDNASVKVLAMTVAK